MEIITVATITRWNTVSLESHEHTTIDKVGGTTNQIQEIICIEYKHSLSKFLKMPKILHENIVWESEGVRGRAFTLFLLDINSSLHNLHIFHFQLIFSFIIACSATQSVKRHIPFPKWPMRGVLVAENKTGNAWDGPFEVRARINVFPPWRGSYNSYSPPSTPHPPLPPPWCRDKSPWPGLSITLLCSH